MIERPDLAALGAELQGELRLVDWQVAYAYVPDLADADGNAVYGLCDRLVDNKTATILIRDPAASKPLPAGAEEKSVEAILMHELVHLHVAPLAVNTPQGITAEEQAVWPIAEALTKWRGTARGEMVARAMTLRGGQRVGHRPARESRSMNRSELAMLKAAMGDGKDPAAALAGVSAALSAYEKTMPEEGTGEPDGDEAKKAAAAARAAEVKDEEDRKARAAEFEKKEPPAARAMTAVDVEQRAAAVFSRMIGEDRERAALIEKNRAHIGEALADALLTMPLASVKTIVEKRRLDAPAPAADQRAARVVVPPVDRNGRTVDEGLDPHDITLMNRLMNTATEKVPAMAKTTRGMEFSHLAVETVGEQIRRMSAVKGA